jgi:hypothetical protein
MKQTVVPAQVTTIEDRIVGNLGISQMILLSLPVLAAGIVFTILPPALHIAVYKLMFLVPFAALCATLSIRIKGKIILFWIIVRVRYNLRPQYYVFDKNTIVNRQLYDGAKVASATSDEPEDTRPQRQRTNLTTAEMIRTFAAMDNPAAKLAFTTDKKGKLHVRITEVKQEN